MFSIKMKKLTLLLSASALVGLLVVPSGASAGARGVGDGHNCTYADDDPTVVTDGDVGVAGGAAVVYTDTTANGSGVSGKADAAAGVCVDGNNAVNQGGVRFDGGTLEAGADDPTDNPVGDVQGVYAVADGDDDNTVQSTKGYVGVSNFETGDKQDGCVQGDKGEAEPGPAGTLDGTAADAVEPNNQASTNETGNGTSEGDCLTLRSPTVFDEPVPGVAPDGVDNLLWGDDKKGALLAVSGSNGSLLLVCGDDSAGPPGDRRWENAGRDGCTGPE